MPNPKQDDQEYPDTLLSVQSFLFLVLAGGIGLLAAVILLPTWMPNLASSLLGSSPKAFWYLSRGSAFVALGLLWASMMLGMLITNKMARFWPGAPTAFAIHEFVSLLGVGFAMFHAIILLGDHFINFTPAQILIPFASGYLPLWVGLGQLGFYITLIVTFTFYIRQSIGHKAWRVIHYASFLTYVMAVIHGLVAGSDTSLSWAQQFYWITSGSLLFLIIYRIIASLTPKPRPVRATHPSPNLPQHRHHPVNAQAKTQPRPQTQAQAQVQAQTHR
jgi:predicted ferric reductase